MEAEKDFQYNISQLIVHHKNILRSITSDNKGLILTGSYDKLCSFFAKQGKIYAFVRDTQYHSDMIYVVRAVHQGFITGSKDTKLILMNDEGIPIREFIGHTGVVNAVSQADKNTFISGSWDATARVWDINTGETKYVLKGHSYAVAVLALPNDRYITGSQDKTLRFWEKDAEYKTVKNAHEDIIRDIILNDNASFYTCSNDCLIKKWSFNGECLETLSGHEGFIFRIFKWKNYLFSAGDDKVVKVWKDDKFVQDLLHPNTIWDLTVTPEGDLLTACADGVIRFFSPRSDEWLPADQIEEYYNQCLAPSKSEEESNSEAVDITKLPLLSDINKVKARQGEIYIFNDNGSAVAYVFNEGKWDKIGDVLGTKPGKKYYQGDKAFPAGEYDYIFDVELEGSTSALPFNKGDNCLVAAEKFIAREGLHKLYIDDITKFLRQNTQEQSSAFKQSKANKPMNNLPKTPTISIKLPKAQFIKFDLVNIEGPLKKISELNQQVKEENPDLSLSLNELDTLSSFLKTIKENQFYHTSYFTEIELNIFLNKLGNWKIENLIPYLDIFRMFLLHPKSQDLFKKMGGGIYEYTRFLEVLKNGSDVSKILVLRIFSNMFLNEHSQLFLKNKRSDLLDNVANLIDSENKTLRSAISALLYNYTIIVNTKDSEACLQLLSLLNEIVMNEKEPKTLIDALIGIANLTHNNIGNIEISKDMDIASSIQAIQNTSDDKMIKELKEYLTALLK